MRPSWDRVWASLSKRPEFKNKKRSAYRFMAIGATWTLTTGQAGASQTVDFPAGGIVLAVAPGLAVSGQAATVQTRDLSGVRIGFQFSGSAGAITTGGASTQLVASSLFGPDGTEIFPADPWVLGPNESILVTPTNLTTSTVILDLAFHTMVPR